MPEEPELAGVTVVVVGSLTPAIFHPDWFHKNDLIAAPEAEHALGQIVLTSGLTAFTADWLSVQVTEDKAVFSTVDEAQEYSLRDVVRGVLELLPHTPVDALGINADAHYRIESEQEWHQVGDLFVPKDFWEPVFTGDWRTRPDSDQRVGLRTMTVEVQKPDLSHFVRVEVAPSVRVQPWGVYVGINSHFQLTRGDDRATASDAARIVDDRWDEARAFEQEVSSKLSSIPS